VLNASTRRAIRTAFDVALGVAAILLIVVPSLSEFGVNPDSEAAILGMVVAATAVASKVRNKLEDLGVIRAVLKSDPPAEH